MNTTSNNSKLAEPSRALKSAIRHIMQPMVRLLLKSGITYPQFSELLKAIYIDVADSDFKLDDKKQTQTRLSFLTGIHRKDVKRLHKQTKTLEEPEHISVGVQLVSKWISDARYLDKQGEPLLLPLKEKDAPCFEELVETVCKQDMRPRVILDEWLNLGIVKLTDNKSVQLCTEAFIPNEGVEEKAFFAGQNIADHLSAVSQNLFNDSSPFFERCVYYEALSDESIEELQSMVADQGMAMLKKINKRAAELKQRDTNSETLESKQRINIGLYLYHENQSENIE